MSEPMSAVEIEDVLSSIRRLVSDDLRPAPRGAAAVAEGDTGGKLILTPALRVVQEGGRTSASDDPAIEAVVAGVGAAVDARAEDWAEDWESETGDQTPGFAEAPLWEDAEEAAPEPAPEPPLQFHAHPRATLLTEADRVPGWAQEGEEDETPQPARWTAATLEPDAAWADEAEAHVLQELSDHVAAAAPLDDMQEALDEAGYDTATYDDEALRDLVRELIVEELQGPLGARITRNIRKLVRAEIARALAAEQLY